MMAGGQSSPSLSNIPSNSVCSVYLWWLSWLEGQDEAETSKRISALVVTCYKMKPYVPYGYISDFNNELHWFPSRLQYTLAITVLEHGLTI